MSKSINIVFIKQSPSESQGTINVRTIEGREIRKKSLGIKIKEKDWNKFFNPKTKRFKKDKNFPLSETINEKIDLFLNELSLFKNDLDNLPDDKKSFTTFWEKLIKTTENHGTRIKHQVVLSKLKKFLCVEKKSSNLLFKDINPFFIRDLSFYLSNSKDPKSLSKNSVIHYLKVIKSIINKSEKEDYYHYSKNPFSSFKFKKEITEKDFLNDDDLTQLINKKIEDPKLDLIRKMFIFQLFSNGMRVSDVLLLRWGNLTEYRLIYKMLKTSELMSIPVNLNMGLIIGDLVNRENRYQDLIDKFDQHYLVNGKVQKFTFKTIDERIKKISVRTIQLDSEDKEKVKINPKLNTYNDYVFDKENTEEVIQLIKYREELLTYVDRVYVGSLFGRIRKLDPTDFVFPILDKEMFKEVLDDKSNISLEQYKMIKHSTIVYNRQLKKVQKICKISTNLSSHVSRHSFTNQLLGMDNVNLYDISQSLGHKNITITQNYISSGFNNKKIDYLNKELSNRFRRKPDR